MEVLSKVQVFADKVIFAQSKYLEVWMTIADLEASEELKRLQSAAFEKIVNAVTAQGIDSQKNKNIIFCVAKLLHISEDEYAAQTQRASQDMHLNEIASFGLRDSYSSHAHHGSKHKAK
ncbi:MAG: hypothetical protein EZS28_018935 [Streblomastix strix]|uniref:ENT domain-containing protein n=1 Tax=Streblomastix strix TaxID=222440 RepID=A0A5J4VT01_9EUKA|nr:MAG: hypothetical protein EZS28_018935 [Streblomastix strix]